MILDTPQISSLDNNLRSLIAWLELRTGFSYTITSMYRIDDPGVHGTMPLRAVDLRCRSFSVGKAIEELINSHWEYDSERPAMSCCKLHGDNSNLHLHLQVHNNTSLK